MFRSSGVFDSPEQLCYQSRMQYVKGHVETYDPEWSLAGMTKRENAAPRKHVWTLEKPEHMRPGTRRSGAEAHARGREGPGRDTIQRNFAQALLGNDPKGRRMPVRADRRLEFMRSVGERKRDLAAKVLAKEKKRREKIDALKKKIPVLKLVYQAGCWFWVDQNTGEATAAQAPDENETSAVGVEARAVLQARPSRCPAADRVKERRMSNHRWKLGIDSDDDESLDSVDRTGTGAQFYDSSEFNDFMNILDSDAVKRRPYSAPVSRRW
ncbi:hypothetical protein SO694_00007360 [Aureococcus anophagefferens]|uniref:Uncharacterized protein n=1 Tax=Aureococcus anophagefferens TaxID=44056 RepID=A0ABR1GBB8_AURAN